MISNESPVRFKFAVDGVPQATGGIDTVDRALAKIDTRSGVLATSLGRIGAGFRSLGSMAGLGGLGVVGGGAALVAFVRNVADGVDKLNDLSDATGASIENLSGLEDMARRTGTGMDTVGSALVKLNQVLGAASPGSETEKTLAAIGLSAKDLKDADPAQALQTVAKALAGYADDGNKARLVQELFGKSVREVAPLLKDLAEAGQLNAKVTSAQAAEVDRFNKGIAQLQGNVVDLSRSLALPLVEAINKVTEAFRLGNIAGEGFFTTLNKRLPTVSGMTAAYKGDEEGVRLARIEDGERELRLLNARIAALDGLNGREQLRDELLRKRNSLAAELAMARIDPLANYGNEGRRAPALPSVPAIGGSGSGGSRGAGAPWATDTLLMYQAEQLRDAFEAIDKINRDWKPAEYIDAANLREAELLRDALEEIEKVNKDAAASTKELGTAVAADLALVFSSAAGEAITNWQGVRGLLKGILQDIAQIALKKTVTDPLGKAVGGFIDGIDFGSILKGLVPKFDTGIDYVPRDMLAYIHKGERVVPAAENRGGGLRDIHLHLAAGAQPDDWNRSKRQIAADLQRSLRGARALG